MLWMPAQQEPGGAIASAPRWTAERPPRATVAVAATSNMADCRPPGPIWLSKLTAGPQPSWVTTRVTVLSLNTVAGKMAPPAAAGSARKPGAKRPWFASMKSAIATSALARLIDSVSVLPLELLRGFAWDELLTLRRSCLGRYSIRWNCRRQDNHSFLGYSCGR